MHSVEEDKLFAFKLMIQEVEQSTLDPKSKTAIIEELQYQVDDILTAQTMKLICSEEIQLREQWQCAMDLSKQFFNLMINEKNDRELVLKQNNIKEDNNQFPILLKPGTHFERIVLCKFTEEKCHICEKMAPSLAVECGEHHCFECLTDHAKSALTDKSLFPLKCKNQPLDSSYIHMLLPEALKKRFIEIETEFNIVNKMYCPKPTCSKVINLEHYSTKDIACPHCSQAICTTCKSATHPRTLCDSNQQALNQQIQEIKKDTNWKRCSKCNHLVEKMHGCRHITCICKYEFCYQCEVKWKDCHCELWNEEELLETMNIRRIPQERREQVRNVLMRNECTHSWRRIDNIYGGVNCENCTFYMNIYHFSCRTCHQKICFRCRN